MNAFILKITPYWFYFKNLEMGKVKTRTLRFFELLFLHSPKFYYLSRVVLVENNATTTSMGQNPKLVTTYTYQLIHLFISNIFKLEAAP